MASDFDKQQAARWYLVNYKTQAEIEAIALQAFSDMQSGKTVTSVSFEGGNANAVVNCDPADLLVACQGALSDIGATTTGTDAQVIFQRFNACPLET